MSDCIGRCLPLGYPFLECDALDLFLAFLSAGNCVSDERSLWYLLNVFLAAIGAPLENPVIRSSKPTKIQESNSPLVPENATDGYLKVCKPSVQHVVNMNSLKDFVAQYIYGF